MLVCQLHKPHHRRAHVAFPTTSDQGIRGFTFSLASSLTDHSEHAFQGTINSISHWFLDLEILTMHAPGLLPATRIWEHAVVLTKLTQAVYITVRCGSACNTPKYCLKHGALFHRAIAFLKTLCQCSF